MGRYLAMYDLSGIQSFIFQTNRLKEIAGASYLVSKVLFANIPELAGEKPGTWKERGADDFSSLEEGSAATVYVGGGNALVLFGGQDAAIAFTKSLKRRVFLQTGGALRICSAMVEVETGDRLADCLGFANSKGLRACLDRSKAKSPQAFTARGFSINRLDNECFEPVLYFDKGIDDLGTRIHAMPRSRQLKLEEYARQHGPAARREYTSPLLELHNGREFKVEFDSFFEEVAGGKHFLAVVHADGNTMGMRIARFLDECRRRDQPFEQDLIDMRDMSVCIGESYKDALGQMIDSVYGNQEGALPFRPVVADGDDITFICKSEKAFECISEFIAALHNPERPLVEREGLPDPSEFSVGVGVAFVKSSYPFSSAYAMAEELCKNAKKVALERRRAGEIESENDCCGSGQPAISSVDFHVCSGELVGDVGDFRNRRLIQREDAGAVHLCMRPYHLGIARPSNESETVGAKAGIDYSLAAFLEGLAELQAKSTGENAWIARSKLKELRNKYGEGAGSARAFGRTIIERDNALRKSGAKGGADREAFIARFGDLYVPTYSAAPNCDRRYAAMFDMLDIIDLCGGARDLGPSTVRAEGGAR